jgi:hypothetical protein
MANKKDNAHEIAQLTQNAHRLSDSSVVQTLEAILAEPVPVDSAPEVAVSYCNRAHAAVDHAGRMALIAAWRIGDVLETQKKSIGHGYWLAWFSAQGFDFSIATAKRYMQVRRRLTETQCEGLFLSDGYERAGILISDVSLEDRVTRTLEKLRAKIVNAHKAVARVIFEREELYRNVPQDDRVDVNFALAVHAKHVELARELLSLKLKLETDTSTLTTVFPSLARELPEPVKVAEPEAPQPVSAPEPEPVPVTPAPRRSRQSRQTVEEL